MKTSNVQPKADQPRVTTKDISSGQPNLQYRIQGAKNYSSRSKPRAEKRDFSRGY